jgi:hypothetical protein
VALNVTVAPGGKPNIGGGYVTVYPCGARPDASNLNFEDGQVLANSVIAPVSSSGDVCFYVYGTAHLLADVSGYFPAGTGFTALTPARLLDTRGGPVVGAADGSGAAYTLNVLNKGGLPGSGIGAVALNVTVAPGGKPNIGGGYVTVYPCGTRPDASNLNFTDGQVLANSVIAPVSSSGDVCFYVYGTAHLLADVSGYFSIAPPDPPAPTSLLFNLAGATGLALPNVSAALTTQSLAGDDMGVQRLEETQLTAASNLSRVAADGSLSPAISRGIADIARFLIAPNGKVYATFRMKTNLETGEADYQNGCLLIEINPDTGIPTCIDSTLSQINWPQEGEPATSNEPIQFDNAGRIYYSGTAADGRTVLRRYESGNITNLINDNIALFDFLVQPDGSVFITGRTESTGTLFTRRITRLGGLETVVNGMHVTWLKAFADGNTYMGRADQAGVYRYLTGSSQLDPKYWISHSSNTPYFTTEPYCQGDDFNTNFGFCLWGGTQIRGEHSISTGNTYVIAGYQGSEGTLMQYFPTLDKRPTAVQAVSILQGISTNLILAGTNSAGQNILTELNTSNDQELLLIGPDNEIEIYHINYVADGNKIMFDGLRFSDNRYVIGQVNLSNGQVSVTPTGTGQLVDFSTF